MFESAGVRVGGSPYVQPLTLLKKNCKVAVPRGGGGGGVLDRISGREVRPGRPNPNPV